MLWCEVYSIAHTRGTDLTQQAYFIVAIMGRKSKENAVLNEYKSIFTRRVDIVGDYAGSETFVVEFDSLLLHCFSNPKLNFDSKF